MRLAVAFGRFWWDFIIGDDWRITAGVLGVLALGAVLVSATGTLHALIAVIAGVGILAVAISVILGSALGALRRERGRP